MTTVEENRTVLISSLPSLPNKISIKTRFKPSSFWNTFHLGCFLSAIQSYRKKCTPFLPHFESMDILMAVTKLNRSWVVDWALKNFLRTYCCKSGFLRCQVVLLPSVIFCFIMYQDQAFSMVRTAELQKKKSFPT